MTRGLRHESSECSIDGCHERPKAHGWCDAHYRRWQRHGDPTKLTHPTRTMSQSDRFWYYVESTEPGECWEWTAYSVTGYGRFRVNGRYVMAHRYAYEELVAPIPDGLTIDHLCRNRACVNPAHLEPVTIQENIRRRP